MMRRSQGANSFDGAGTTNWPSLICLLGDFQLLKAGCAISVRGGGKTEALLSYLGIHYNQRVPRETLLNTLWASGDPALAGQSLNSLVYSLGKLLSDAIGGVSPIVHVGGTVTIADVKMGPFPQGGLTNLYATQEQRPTMPGGLLPPFPTVNPGDVVLWAYNGRKVYTNASALIGGGSVGGVTLTITGYDAGFSPVALPSNLDDSLTLDIDNTGLSIAHINSLRAFRADHTEVASTGSNGDCPAYHIGAGGYVELNVTVQDSNGHLFEADFQTATLKVS